LLRCNIKVNPPCHESASPQGFNPVFILSVTGLALWPQGATQGERNRV